MSDTVTLLSTHQMTREELFEVIEGMRQKGTDIDPEEVFDARISRDEGYIWVLLYSGGVEELPEKAQIQIKEILEGSPQSGIDIEIGRQPGSQELAVELACLFAERWPCVVYDLRGKVFSHQELFELRRSGKGFLE
jgi:hypothetical protein